tara:strand:- start:19584 stop:21494 length:1911 start_codon:yes stop_codon:yes gene_type:complete
MSNQLSSIPKQSNITTTTTIEEAVEYCLKADILGVDTETEGLDFLTKKLIMFQIGDDKEQFVIDTRHISIEPFREVLESKNILKLLHHVKFDYKFIKKWANIELECIYDTKLVESILNCGREGIDTSLLGVTKKYLNITLDKEERNKFIDLESTPFTETQIVYGANDVKYLDIIRRAQLDQIVENDLGPLVDLENGAALAFADIEYNGMEFDKDKWIANAQSHEIALEKYEKELDNIIIQTESLGNHMKKSIQGNLFTPVEELRKVDVLWSSPKQVLAVFSDYGLDLEKVNAFELSKYRRDYPLVDKYIQYKVKQKIISTYGKSFVKYISDDGKVRTSFWQILNTGRVSSGSKRDRKPNMQNIPADNTFRNCFHAREGYKIVSVDYSGQELRIIAAGSKDPVWIKCIEAKQDLHSVCAELVYGEEWKNAAEKDCAFYLHNKQKCNCSKHKKLRTNVKTINFGLAYGMSKFKLSDTLKIPVQQADKLIRKYFTAFPKIKHFLELLGRFGKQYGFICTYAPYRRKRWFGDWSPNLKADTEGFKTLGRIERASKNTPIQGTGADMIKSAMVKIREYIKKHDFPGYLITQVHDEIGVEVVAERAQEWAVIQSELMEEAGAEIIDSIKMEVEYTISEKWCK